MYAITRSLSENWKGPRSWLGRRRCKAARRRRCRCTSSRSANEADAPSKPEPEGRMGVARRSLRCSSSTMCIGIASSSRLALAVQAPCARPLRILGQAPSPCCTKSCGCIFRACLGKQGVVINTVDQEHPHAVIDNMRGLNG